MERLSHWPYWKNANLGYFSVYKLPQVEGGDYIVDSTHKTCFFAGLYCCKSLKSLTFICCCHLYFILHLTVKANGQFKFSTLHSSKDTHVIETVQYQCPPFMGNFCKGEVEFQRRAILDNLKVYFEQN